MNVEECRMKRREECVEECRVKCREECRGM
jgi:hypothetical protein